MKCQIGIKKCNSNMSAFQEQFSYPLRNEIIQLFDGNWQSLHTL